MDKVADLDAGADVLPHQAFCIRGTTRPYSRGTQKHHEADSFEPRQFLKQLLPAHLYK